MQTGRGHRVNLMSIGQDFYNVGKAIVQESDGGTDVGPLVITENYCEANTSFQDHYNNFIVGTVWTDSNENSQYDPGEGESGVTVTPDSGTYYAVTADSGGYAIPVTSQSISTVTFSGTSLGTDINKPVSVGTESVLLDVETGYESTVTYPAELDITANNSDGPVTISAGDPLTVAISIDAGSYSGASADWYIVVNTSSGWQSFNVSQMDYSISGLSALIQGYGLISFGPAAIFSTTSLSAGTYTYYFAVVLTSGQFYYDIVTVNVQ
jgi:hypothetical protein